MESSGWSPWQGSSFSPGSCAGGSLLGDLGPGPSDAVSCSPSTRLSAHSVGSLPAFAFADSAGSPGRLRLSSTHAGSRAQDAQSSTRASVAGFTAVHPLPARLESGGGLRSASELYPPRPWSLMGGVPSKGFATGGPHPQEDNDDEELHDALCCPITQVRSHQADICM